MASFVFNNAAKRLMDQGTGTIHLLSDIIKCMLVGTTGGGYTENRDHDFVNSITASVSDELTATNYTAGFAGAGRKTLASKTITEDDTNDRAEFDAADVTWTALGGATNDTIAKAALIKEVTDDTASPMIAVIDFTDVPTNGSDVTLVWDAEGIVQLSTT